MNCKFMVDVGVNPEWTEVADEEGVKWPVRDYYGTFRPECRRFPPTYSENTYRFPFVASDAWCAEWKPTDDFLGQTRMRSQLDLDWKRVSSALTALMRRTNDDSHAIFSDRETEKFVQFVRNKRTNGLWLDLPSQPLDNEAMSRATTYFGERGISISTNQMYQDVESKFPAGTQLTFEMDLEQDVQRATKIVFEIFDLVYALPASFDLVISEN